jgi:hypothetical protein
MGFPSGPCYSVKASFDAGGAMATIIIRLDPTKLENPDLDLRYVLPSTLEKASGGLVRDDAYDYDDDDVMLVFLETEQPTEALELVHRFLRDEMVLGNHLADKVEIYLKDESEQS